MSATPLASQSDRYLLWLDTPGAGEAALVGGKAAHLAQLAQAGYQVPVGFSLTLQAFHTFVRENRLEGELAAVLEPGAEAQALARRIEAGAWPGDLEATVRKAYAALQERIGERAVAVRSSATGEDSPDASFAGQHKTFLDVRGPEAVLRAIRSCWASLCQREALRYRSSSAVAADAALAMGVLVQVMVPAESSGVAFTVDPAGGDRNVITIDAGRGLGEALVAGQLVPDHHALRKADLQVVRRALATEAEPVLSDLEARRIAELALALERHFGAPQDIEWALAGGQIWILQSRPVTGLREGPAEWQSEFDTPTDRETHWTSTNIQEVMPGLLSPLTQSLLLEDFAEYTRQALARMGITLPAESRLVGSFYGRAFLNQSLAQDIGGQSGTADKHYLSDSESPAPKGKRWRRLRMALVVAPRALVCFARLARTVRTVEERSHALDAADATRALGELAVDELVRLHEVYAADFWAHGAMHVLVSIYTGSVFTGLGKVCAKWLGDQKGELQGRLCKGLADMDSARPAFELWDLAALVRESGPESARFRAELEAFLHRHGHHGVSPMELSARSWEEDEPALMVMIQNYLRAGPERSPAATQARCGEDREAATRESLERLKRWQRPVFRFLLQRSQRWIATREHTKSLLIRSLHRRRRLFRELGRRLAEKRLLASVWDLYYLTWDEIRALCRGEMSAHGAALTVRRRRAEETRNRQVALPEDFRGRPQPIAPEPALLSERRTLEGTPVSRGVVTGRARVIHDPREDAMIEPGEILVAPVTDAAWAPLFTVAAGLVVDIGGTLSHGSTVAREYGIPAVVNVKTASKLIRTGDTITVDGGKGLVILA